MATYTDDQLRAEVDRAVAAAVASAEARVRAEFEPRLAELTDAQQEAARQQEIATAVEAAVSPLQAQVEQLQTDLDAKTLEASALQEQVTAFETAAAAAAAEAERQERVQAVRQERIDKVKAVAGNRPSLDTWLEENGDRWAEMTDEKFEATLEAYRETASAFAGSGGLPRPQTAMTATATAGGTPPAKGGGDSPSSGAGLLRELRELRPAGAGADRS